MKIFSFRGGIHPDGRKHLTADRAIERGPLVERLFVPMQQHIGAPAEPCVALGQRVLKGELIGRPQGAISAPVHAPTSGRVAAIGEHAAPHPSGLPVLTVTIEADGEDRWAEFPIPRDPLEIPPELIAERVAQAGIVGMGGATFPAAIKLGGAANRHIHTLIVNGGECEPWLTCDDRLMRERADTIVDGIRILLHAIRWGRAVVAIEDNKPEACAAMSTAARGLGNIEVVQVPTRYPMGSEKHLIRTVTGSEVPAGGLPAQVGVIVHNVATVHAISEAIRYGRPLVSRVVTVGGGAIREPRNVEVPVGTPLSKLVEYCGGFTETPARLLMGGPMMGQVVPFDAPVVKGTSGITALTAAEARPSPPQTCIRCARCVAACPMGLMPLEMAARIRAEQFDAASEWGLSDCIACGSCSYVCQAKIPLVQYFNFAKGWIVARRAAQDKSKTLRTLAEQRKARLEREAREKAEAAARRKAERDAKKAAEART